MASNNPSILLLLMLLFLTDIAATSLSTDVAATSLSTDIAALLAFKSSADPTGSLLPTWNLSSPCLSWHGLTCSPRRVTRLVLENLSLSGPIPPSLATLDALRVLSLKSNLLSGPIPPSISALSSLKLLFLSHNLLSGPIPPSVSLLPRLYRLDLSFNNLSGPIPASALNSLTHLLTLRLNHNSLAGPISGLNLSSHLQDLNLSSNLLAGAVPRALSSFPTAAFAHNPSLCGAPLPSCSPNADVSDPSRPRSGSGGEISPEAATVSSNPSPKPEVAPPAVDDSSRRTGGGGGMSRVAVVAIVVGDFAVLVLVSGLLFCYFWRKFAANTPSRLQEGEKIVYSSSPYAGRNVTAGGFERGRMVFFDSTKRFELEDLLRASAEMLGKGGYGTAYKAILDDGAVVAVKRLRDVQIGGKREFDGQMEALGRLRHPNLVPLKAYYYARDEKLLVYDFMPGGSLFSALHGNRGPGRTPLDWTARIRIAAGTARGLAFIHHAAGRAQKLAHGNVKSTNVLLDQTGTARLADFGLALLGPATGSARSNGYRAPEAPSDGRRAWATQSADVYAFGVVLLEILTGKVATDGVDLPRWVQSVVREEWTAEVFDLELMRYKGIEEEMVGMLQIALACTAIVPDQRPRIGHVLKMIEEIRGGGGGGGGEVSPSHESFESDSPSVSDDTAGGTSQ